MSNPLGNFDGDVQAWRIRVERGPFQGVRYYEVMIQSEGAWSGGETQDQWFGMGECRYDERRGIDLLKYLLEGMERHDAVSEDDITLAEDLLAYHGIEVES